MNSSDLSDAAGFTVFSDKASNEEGKFSNRQIFSRMVQISPPGTASGKTGVIASE